MRRDRVIGCAAAAALLWSAYRACSATVSPAEERAFRIVNDASGEATPLVWSVMQAGSLPAVFVAAEGTRRRAGGVDGAVVAVAGTAVWGGVKLVKPLVGRGRPTALLPDVHVRGGEQTGLGFPSGHAAVAMALALIAFRSPRARRVAVAVAAVTAVGRVHVGAHLPLDAVGGVATGWLAGTAARRALDHHRSGGRCR